MEKKFGWLIVGILNRMKNFTQFKTIILVCCLMFVVTTACSRLIKDNNLLSSKGQLKVLNPRCEYRLNPLGIGQTKPRLSWIITSNQRGQRQTAYQILVASSRQKLKENKADLWNSTMLAGGRTSCIVYNGKQLKSGMECFWKVRVWDKNGRPSDWSETAIWTMGLLEKNDWQAKWIGFDKPEKPDDKIVELEKSRWIWYPDFESPDRIAPQQRFFRFGFELPDKADIKSVDCFIAADDGYRLFINGRPAGSGRSWNTINKIVITDLAQEGKNVIAVSATNEGQSPNPAGLIVAVQAELTNGEKISFVTDKQWLCTNKAEQGWNKTDFNDSSWISALEIGTYGCQPWGEVNFNRLFLPPAKYLRKEFVAEKKIKKAYLYATAFGLYQVHINGRRVGNDYFSPGWTDYNKRIYYRTYDVTSLLQKGENAIAAMLADGWYAGYVGFGGKRNHYGEKLRLLAQLCVEYSDGTKETIISDKSWKASLGPILQADFLMGETYDARLEMMGWNKPGFDDSSWSAVELGSELNPQVEPAVTEPVVAFAELKPVKITEPVTGHFVFDMGQNFAGVVRLKLKADKGQRIILRHAERLNPDGTIYTTNLRSAAATDTYICKGQGIEIWQPYFTFHGFQYVELTGIDYKPAEDTVTGIALSSNTPVAGSFECSSEMVNQLYSNIVWTQRANFIDIPTDCPQRDERLGWTGDAQVFIRTACMNMDVQTFFTKWLTDLRDTQRADGQFPSVAPLKVAPDDGGPAWADAGVICPWTIYYVYADKQILEKNYESMKRFVDFCENRCTSDLLPPARFHCYGDWLNINDDTPRDVIYMAYFGCSTKLTAGAAEVLAKTEDAKYYNELFGKIKASFNKAYVSDDGKIKGDSQTAYVLAIAYDLLDEQKQKLAAEHLIEKIKQRNWHLSTGFVGTKDLMLVLSKIKRDDLAYRLLLNDTFPSWGFSIKNGATSIWERWNGWTPDKGFADPSMNSFAHYAFGAVGQWMFENIGGIKNKSAGFKEIIIQPKIGGNLEYAKTSFVSIHGRIATGWKIDADTFVLNVTIPANTTAFVYVPTIDVESILIDGLKVDDTKYVKFLRIEDNAAVYMVDSGNYSFVSKIR